MLYLAQEAIKTATEHRGFVFAVTFIIIFSVLISTIPTGLKGPEETLDMVTPLEPSIISGFSESQNYTASSYSPSGGWLYTYVYDLGGRTWLNVFDDSDDQFYLGAKILYAGFLWLGQVDSVKFVSSDGVDRGEALAFTEIDADVDDGVMRYDLIFIGSGGSAGGFVVYWNTTTYNNSSIAWDNNELYLLHGVGIADTATADIGSLLISLLLLQIPEVPLLVNVFLIIPIWASIIFVLWYVIKEMIPFV